MQTNMTIRIESLREAEAIRLQRLLALKRIGATVDYGDGRKLNELIEEAKTAVRSLDYRIEAQHPRRIDFFIFQSGSASYFS